MTTLSADQPDKRPWKKSGKVEFDVHRGRPVCATVRLRRGKLSHSVQPKRGVFVFVEVGRDGRPALIEFFQPVPASVALEILIAAFAGEQPTNSEWRAAVRDCAKALRWWEKAGAAA